MPPDRELLSGQCASVAYHGQESSHMHRRNKPLMPPSFPLGKPEELCLIDELKTEQPFAVPESSSPPWETTPDSQPTAPPKPVPPPLEHPLAPAKPTEPPMCLPPTNPLSDAWHMARQHLHSLTAHEVVCGSLGLLTLLLLTSSARKHPVRPAYVVRRVPASHSVARLLSPHH